MATNDHDDLVVELKERLMLRNRRTDTSRPNPR